MITIMVLFVWIWNSNYLQMIFFNTSSDWCCGGWLVYGCMSCYAILCHADILDVYVHIYNYCSILLFDPFIYCNFSFVMCMVSFYRSLCAIHWFVINSYFELWNVFLQLAMGCRVMSELKIYLLLYSLFFISNCE